MQHVARLTDAALLAGGEGFGAGILTVDIHIRAGRLTRRQAAGEVAVGWALQGCGGEGEVRGEERRSEQAEATDTTLEQPRDGGVSPFCYPFVKYLVMENFVPSVKERQTGWLGAERRLCGYEWCRSYRGAELVHPTHSGLLSLQEMDSACSSGRHARSCGHTHSLTDTNTRNQK